MKPDLYGFEYRELFGILGHRYFFRREVAVN